MFKLYRLVCDWFQSEFNSNERQRRLDIRVLWPKCLEATLDLDLARGVFLSHVSTDPVWASLGMDEVKRRVDALPDWTEMLNHRRRVLSG